MKTRLGGKKGSKASLKAGLESLRKRYDARYLSSDPLQFLHRYHRPEDQEIVGLIASSLAFGNVPTIHRSVESVLARMGHSPSLYVKRLDPREALLSFSRFKHRWTTGRDVVCLLLFVRQMIQSSGSIGGFFRDALNGDTDLRTGLCRFSTSVQGLDHGGLYRAKKLPKRAGVRYFFPNPAAGSACKRLNLFLRWMVRPDDGLDLGLWNFVPPSGLIMPLDTHIARIGIHLGWTQRKTAGWNMALDITRALARVDPKDPVKYDFALSRMGILEKCPRHSRKDHCDLCDLRRWTSGK
jgi:uncharacterized protein (TIGR02757 family)